MSENRYDVTVHSCDRRDSLAWLSLGRARLAARRWDGIRVGQRMTIRIRPEDVLLCEGHPGRISARNVLPGHVRKIRYVEGGVAVDLDAGFPLTALITRTGAKELRLKKGAPVFAIIKAVVVAPEVEIHATVRVSLAGPKGLLDHDKIDFLRAIARAGSLSAAAKEVGITYRTAWMWARGINQAWTSPLVARTHGGKGGGGTSLTPEGHSAVALASKIEAQADGLG